MVKTAQWVARRAFTLATPGSNPDETEVLRGNSEPEVTDLLLPGVRLSLDNRTGISTKSTTGSPNRGIKQGNLPAAWSAVRTCVYL